MRCYGTKVAWPASALSTSAYAVAAVGVCRDGLRHATRIARLAELPGNGLLDHPDHFYRRIKPERRLRSHGLQLTDAS